MKKLIVVLLLFIVALPFSVSAASSNVIYSGDSGSIVFESGSQNNPSDLFDNFKSVMPGDTLTQKITVYNKASNKVKVKIYLRSLGAQNEPDGFLSSLRLKVKKSEQNDMAYMFDASADKSAGLADWFELGTLYSGGKVDLDVILEVPSELDNSFADTSGSIIWEFKVEEYPIEDTDPTPPATGDNSSTWFMTLAFAIILIIFFILLFKRRKRERDR